MAIPPHALALIIDLGITHQQLGKIERYARERDEECIICYDEKKTLELSCGCTACAPCILASFKCAVLNGEGMPEYCINKLHFFDAFDEEFLTETEVVDILLKKLQVAALKTKMNIFVCENCGPLENKTPNCYKRCPKCRIDVCAFCQEKWDASMKPQDYFCSDQCVYVNHCTYGYKNFAYGPGTIPDRRFCPRCGSLGAYDSKCKFHKCSCEFEFCFFCLQEKNKGCPGSTYNKRCEEKVQTFDELWAVFQPK